MEKQKELLRAFMFRLPDRYYCVLKYSAARAHLSMNEYIQKILFPVLEENVKYFADIEKFDNKF